MRLPEAFFLSKEIDLGLKDHDQEMGELHNEMAMVGGEKPKQFRVGKVNVEWKPYVDQWKTMRQDLLPQAIASYLLPWQLSPEQMATINSFADKDNTEDYIKSISILIMELPEFQLV